MNRFSGRKILLTGVATAVMGGGVAAAFVVPALASPASASLAASSAPSRTAQSHPAKPHAHADAVMNLVRRLAAETAKETGESRSQVMSQLRSGSTLNQVAGAKASAVVDAVVAAAQQRLDTLVSRGRLTAAQEQATLERLRTGAEELMTLNLAPFLPQPRAGHPAAPPSPATTAA